MPIDACKVGFCHFYDSGDGVFGMIVGVAIGVFLILTIQWAAKRRGRK